MQVHAQDVDAMTASLATEAEAEADAFNQEPSSAGRGAEGDADVSSLAVSEAQVPGSIKCLKDVS